LDHHKEEEKFLRDPSLWGQIGYPTLESAYQRFLLHYRPSTVFNASPVALAVANDFVEGTPRPSRTAKRA